jgi:TonB-linked outer membrane protein, SusC/RagA family
MKIIKNKISKTTIHKAFITSGLLALNVLSVISFVLLPVQNSLGQDPNASLKTITGIVRDAASKKGIPTAQIHSLNWEAAASVKDDGSFKVKVGSLDEVLSVSAIDYGSREVSVKGKDSVVVELYPSVFINSYKTVPSLTGLINNSLATQSLNNSEDFSKTTSVTVDNEIQSQLGGNVRSISRSGTAGIGTSLFIRGLNSLNANAQPLYVVDGVLWEIPYDAVSLHSGFFSNPLATIDMANIESISVIKDGTSIYGSKGANGVIVIKTVHGKDVVTKITANSFAGVVSRPTSIPVMDASQFRIYASDLLSGTSSGKDITNVKFLNDDPSVSYYPVYHNATDWQREIYQTGITQNYSLSVNGGDDKALYALSVGYTSDKGVVKNTDMQRLFARFNADINFTSNLTMNWNIAYTEMNRRLVDDGVNFLTSPTFLSKIKAPFLSPYQYTANGEHTSDYEDSDDFGVGNPLAVAFNSLNTNKQYRFNIGVVPKYQISKYLTIQDNLNYSLYNIRENNYRPKIGADSVRYTQYNFVSDNEIRNQISKNIAIFNDAQLIFDQKFNHYHHVKGVLGWRYQNNNYTLDYGEGHNTQSDSYRSLDDATYKFTDGLDNKSISVSTYASVDYSFKNRYLVSAVFDMDASSRFGQESKGGFEFLGRKWGAFPSVNGAWILSSEPFMRNINFVNFLKIRAGYGLTGNDDMGYYGYRSYLVSKDFMGQAVGLIVGNIANKDIQWETTYRTNVGMDLSFLNERIALSADLYSGTTKNLLVRKPYPDITGLGYYWENSGELSNKGIEVSANFKMLNLKSVKWELGLSAGHYKNKIVSLPGGQFTTQEFGGEVLTAVGKPVGVFYGYKTNGVFKTQAEADQANLTMVDSYGVSHSFGAGDVRFVEIKKDGVIDANDKQVIGDPNPKLYGSFNSMVSFKNVTLNILFTYSYGNDVYNYVRSQMENGGWYNQTTEVLNRWRVEGQQTSQPKAVYGDPMGNARFSDRWIEDGSFLKLKTLTLSYKVPLKTSFIEGINVWFSANNIFILTKYLGLDPEVSATNSVLGQGIDAGYLPNTRSYFVGVRLSL